MSNQKVLSAISGLLFFCPALVLASPVLEEITVTANFRESNLMTTAGSISVVGENTIRERAAEHLEQIINIAPNVSFSSGGSRARFVQIRGVGDLEQFNEPKHFPSVGIAIDGIALGGTASNSLLLDAKQVEVLRGPQGTRFGANALAGMINITSNDPTEELSGRIGAGVGNYDSRRATLVLSGPLSDKLGGRVALQSNRSDGYIENTALGRDDTNNLDETSVRAKLRWQASESVQIDFNALYADMDNGYDAWSLDNNRQTLSDQPGQDAQKFSALSLDLSWAVNEYSELQAIVTKSRTEQAYGFDEDWTYVGICDDFYCPWDDAFSGTDHIDRDRDESSIDVRLLSSGENIEGVIGVYYQSREEDMERSYYGSYVSNYETRRTAMYAQLSGNVTEKLRLLGGLRFEQFEDDFEDSYLFNSDSRDGFMTGELSLEYSFNDNQMFYATLSQGAKPGGVNVEASSSYYLMQPAFQTFMADKLRFATETLFNKEIGLKGNYLDQRLRMRLAVFHMDRSNAQLESWMWDDVSWLWIGYLDSVNAAESYGAELELDFMLTDSLQLFANLGLLKTEVDEIGVFDLDVYDFVTRTDREQAKSPRYQFNVGGRYQFTSSFSGRLEVEGRDESYFGYYHNGQLDAYSLVHASVNWQQGNFDVQLWGRNLGDHDYAVHGLYFGNDPRKGWVNETYRQWGEPRSYGIAANYHF
ncbi:MAG: TonB-dependent receptor [Pseudomonadales bacterium]